ncbi:MAG: hypothetical protein H7195_09720 [Chryseobacterium sp.]|nr:hypothetical protein [Chryseobacterium sp.]
MSQIKIIIPNTINKLSWINFLRIQRAIDYSTIDKIIFDFNKCSFLDTGCLTMLACFIEEIYNKKKIKFEYIGGTKILNIHLDNIRFKEYWNQDFDRNVYTNSKNLTTLCLWHISSSMIETYGQQAQLYYQRQFFQHLDLQPFSATLVEIFNNIFNHSKSIVDGYVLTQYFPNIHRMSFAVCDFGVGIPTSINTYQSSNNKEIYTPDSFAIEKSLEAGISSKSIPQNAGLGLSNVLDFSENSDGIINIYSNYGFFSKSSGQEPILNTLRFAYNGTLIMLDIDTQYFEEFDSENEIYDFC